MPTPELLRNTSRYVVGVSLLLGVVVLWTASNFITAALETGEDSWNKPFLITYINTASFTIYLIPPAFRYIRSQFRPNSPSKYQPISTLDHDGLTIPSDQLAINDELTNAIPLDKLSFKETAQIAAWWSAMWFIANWAINIALGWTSVASVTILSGTSGFFTLALGRVFKTEQITRVKVFAAVTSFAGVVLVTRSDSYLSSEELNTAEIPPHPVLGDIATLLSAAFYAAYTILIRVRVGDEDRADSKLLLGLAGLYNIVFLSPVIPLLHWSVIEKFELPPSKVAVISCLINMGITVSGDYLYMLAALKTTPMLVTIGLSLTIPLTLFLTLFIPSASQESITFVSLIGAACVLVGFGLMGMQGYEESKEGGNTVPIPRDTDPRIDEGPIEVI